MRFSKTSLLPRRPGLLSLPSSFLWNQRGLAAPPDPAGQVRTLEATPSGKAGCGAELDSSPSRTTMTGHAEPSALLEKTLPRLLTN